MSKEKGIPRVDALTFTCPKCGSTPGNYCMTEKGHVSKVPHVKRSKLIERSYHVVLAQQPRPNHAMSSSELRSLKEGDTVFADGREFKVRSVASTWVFLVNDPRPININQAALCSKRERIPVFKSRDDFIKSRTDKIRYACLKVAVSKLKFDSLNMTAGLRDELIATLERHKVKVLE